LLVAGAGGIVVVLVLCALAVVACFICLKCRPKRRNDEEISLLYDRKNQIGEKRDSSRVKWGTSSIETNK